MLYLLGLVLVNILLLIELLCVVTSRSFILNGWLMHAVFIVVGGTGQLLFAAVKCTVNVCTYA